MFDWLIIGAQKAGTTWLWENLRTHRQVFTPAKKEIHFWDKLWPEGEMSLSRYMALFAKKGERRAGEATPAYGHLPENAIRRMQKVNSNVRLIYVLRNPVLRSWSQCVQTLRRAGRRVDDTHDAWFLDELQKPGVAARSDYASNLRRWRSVFSQDQLLVPLYDQMCDAPGEFLRRCAEHVGIDPAGFSTNLLDCYVCPPTGKAEGIRASLFEPFRKFYEPMICELERQEGLDLSHWRLPPASDGQSMTAQRGAAPARCRTLRSAFHDVVMVPVVVHVGLPKTGTTMLQDNLCPHESQIEFLGEFAGRRGRGQFKNTAVRKIIRRVAGEGMFQADAQRCRATFEEKVAPEIADGKISLLSLEDFTAGSCERRAARAKNLRAVFGACKIVLTLRNPASFAESMFAHQLRTERASGFWPLATGRRFARIEDRLEALWSSPDRGALSHLDYGATVEIFVEHFGRENVGLFLYEEFAASRRAFLTRMCEFVGIDASQAVRTENALAAKAPESFFSDRTPLSSEWRTRLEDLTRDGNERIAREWNLPLEEYGYPMPVSQRAA